MESPSPPCGPISKGKSAATYKAVAPESPPQTVLAALGPKMLELAAESTDGAHPYNVSPEHTHDARAILGPNKLLCVEQGAVLETDSTQRSRHRPSVSGIYLTLPNYVNNWRRLGFTDTDFAGGGSDRLVDSVVVWGDETAIRKRIEAHWQAGADHVCVQALGAGGRPDERLLELLAGGRGATA